MQTELMRRRRHIDRLIRRYKITARTPVPRPPPGVDFVDPWDMVEEAGEAYVGAWVTVADSGPDDHERACAEAERAQAWALGTERAAVEAMRQAMLGNWAAAEKWVAAARRAEASTDLVVYGRP